jgi:uncharacterized protein YeaO (DUF488 family)
VKWNLLTKRVREPRAAEDGARILVMRLWPRGARKEHFDAWERDLAPSVELMRSFLDGKLSWGAYRKRYLAEVRERARAKSSEHASRRGRPSPSSAGVPTNHAAIDPFSARSSSSTTNAQLLRHATLPSVVKR